MIIDLGAVSGDDPDFIQIVTALARDTRPRELRLIRIAGWFDHRWLDFSGIGLVAFDTTFPAGHPGVALDEVRQDHTTFPPFAPGRVLDERRYLRTDPDVGTVVAPEPPVHPRRRARSAANLQRRMIATLPDSVCLWFSSDSATTRRAAVMAYLAHGDLVDAWYASFFGDRPAWRLGRTRGTSPAAVEAMLRVPPTPAATPPES
ncbi:MAG: hypothetical protein JNK64_07905 [Myxococcales bacterium]|nr:hypothetical protein [Myxococcales bacterium]